MDNWILRKVIDSIKAYKEPEGDGDYWEGFNDALDSILSDISKLQEEPVSDTQSPVIFYGLTGSVGSPKKEPVSEQNLSNVQRTVKNLKEPVSEEFENHYAKYSNDIDAEYPFPIDISDYKEFAKDFYNLGIKHGELLNEGDVEIAAEEFSKRYSVESERAISNYSFIRGASWDKMRMMQDAVSGKHVFNPNNREDDFLMFKKGIIPQCKIGSEVKLIIIRED